MRFSDIQDNPLKYNLNALLKELKNYFTVYVHRYPFISYIDNDQLTLTLHNETLSPTDVVVQFRDDPILKPDFKKAYISSDQLKALFDTTVDNETSTTIKPNSFSKKFLQKLICNTTPIQEFRELLHDAIANKALEKITGYSSNELNIMFNEYFEDNLLDCNITYKLHFKYRFLDTRRIELRRYDEKFELVKSELTNKWMLNKELPGHFIEKFKDDCTTINNLIKEQPTELELALNKPLPQELCPYINAITHFDVTMYTHNHGPKWIINSDYVTINRYDIDYSIQNYELQLDVPMCLTYDDDNLAVLVFPVQPGQSLKPIQKAIDLFQKSIYQWNNIKEQLKYAYIKDLIEKEIIPKRDVIKQLIFSSKNKVLRFKEDHTEYRLTIQENEALYSRDSDDQITFIKTNNDFEISLRYSYLRRTKISELPKTIQELIDKI